MGKVTTAIAIKFVITFLASWVVITLIAGSSWTWALLVAIIATAINYIIVDKMILPDTAIWLPPLLMVSYLQLLLWIVDLIAVDLVLNATAYITMAVIMIVAEYFFQRYLIDSGIVEIQETKASEQEG